MVKLSKNSAGQIISKNDYIPELEDDVKFWTTRIKPPKKKNKKLYTRNKPESFKNPTDQLMWEKEEIRRCVEGYDGMCGKHYFYFNYCNILSVGGGKISPDFRVCGENWFTELEDSRKKPGTGIVCVKRRRIGASWMEAADALHDVTFNRFYHVGINSKSEADTIELFKKVKLIYNNLPKFLRATAVAGNSKLSMDFSFYVKDARGNKIKRGNQSYITCKAPTPSAFEGLMLNKWISDEAGKVEQITQMFSFTEPCLMDGTSRIGIPVLFGTSGEIGHAGRGLKEMWDNAEAYHLKRFFFAGYMGLIYDIYGNDLIEEGIRWIIYERYRRRNLSPKQYNDFIQQFPLTEDEAFAQASTGGIGDAIKINRQMKRLAEHPPKKVTGIVKEDETTGDVVFMPRKDSNIIIYEHPEPGTMYHFGCDPADHDSTYNTESDLALYVMKERIGAAPPYIVAEYVDRPKKLAVYYKNAAMLGRYYNNSKILIESNRYRMISWFEENGYKYLLSPTPQGVWKFFRSRIINSIGVRMTKDVKEDYLEGLIEDYIDFYCDYIPSRELLQECLEYGSTNTDRVMAFGICLMLVKEQHRRKGRSKNPTHKLPDIRYIRTAGGEIVRALPKERYNPHQKNHEIKEPF